MVGFVAVLGSTALPVGLVAADGVSEKPTSTSSRAVTSAPVDRFVATELPDSAVGRQASWLIEASARLPLSDAELREHLSKGFLKRRASRAQKREFLGALADAQGLRLLGLTVVEPAAVVAMVQGRAGRRLVLTIFVDRAGRIDIVTLGPPIVLPRPTGRADVGSDRVELVDRAGANRRLMLTRWYPTAGPSRDRPLAQYASPSLAAALAAQYADDPRPAAAALGLPAVRVSARAGARPRPGRLPVVLFSPGGGTSRVLYQAFAEDLASHGYLVVAVDHTGEAPVELADGQIMPPLPEGDIAIRLVDMRLVLRRLNTMASGPRADRRHVAAIGHSLGGATAAALMRAEPTVRAGVDIDGLILGSAARRGVPRAFMVMGGEGGPLAYPGVRGLLKHSRGPLLALEFAGFEHFSFSDGPVIAPGVPGVGKGSSARSIAVQRAYLRAFLDRYLRGRRSRLLEGPSTRWPQVSFRYRQRLHPPHRSRATGT